MDSRTKTIARTLTAEVQYETLSNDIQIIVLTQIDGINDGRSGRSSNALKTSYDRRDVDSTMTHHPERNYRRRSIDSP